MRKNPAAFFLVPDRFKTQKLCIMAVNVDPWQLNDIPAQITLQHKKCVMMQRGMTHILYIF